MKQAAVITARDEGDTIGPLVSALRERFDPVIVINDGSMDDTGFNAAHAGAHVITHYPARGIAASLMEAWRKALDSGADRVLQIDAGGSHEPLEAFQFLRINADVVVGSRFHPSAFYNGGIRQYFSRAYSFLCNFAIGGFVTSDWTSGYRLFSRHALEVLLREPPFWSGGHTWQAEVIHRAIRSRLSVDETPITYTAGRSSMKLSHIDDAILVLIKVMFV